MFIVEKDIYLGIQFQSIMWAASIDRFRTIYIQILTTLDGESTRNFHGVIRTRLLQHHPVDRKDLLNHLDFINKIKSYAASLGNLENQIGQLAIALSNRPQGNLPSNTKDPRKEGKEHYKVINLRFGKDVHSPVGVLKRRVESTSIQRETQIQEESQSFTSQHTGKSSQATASAKNDDPTPVDNEAATPTQNMEKEK